MIRVKQLRKVFGPQTALHDLTFDCAAGSITGLLGANGAGKSTALQLLAGCLPPTSGEIWVAGYDLSRQAQAAKRCLGYLPENPPLYPELTVTENLMFWGRLRGLRRAALKASLERVIALCGLATVVDSLCITLSRGFRQRVGLAQALLHDPPVLLLDEPTNGMDPGQLKEFRALLLSLAGSKTVLLSTHLLSEVKQVCRAVIMLAEGRVLRQQTVTPELDDVALERLFLPQLEAAAAAPE